MKAYISIGALVTTALILLFAVFGSFYTIDQGELGVQTTNGRVTGVAPPGLGFKLPFIQAVEKMDVRTRKTTFDQMEAYSRDIQAANLRITVNWKLNPGKVAEIYSEYGQHIGERLLIPTVMDRSKIVFGQYNAATSVQERSRLVADITKAIQDRLGGNDILLESVQLENIDFSNAFQASIEQRMQAEIEVQRLEQNLRQDQVTAERRRVEARGLADAAKAKADGDAYATLTNAKADAEAIRIRGEAIQAAPGLVALETAKRWDGKLPSTMVPGSAVPFVTVR